MRFPSLVLAASEDILSHIVMIISGLSGGVGGGKLRPWSVVNRVYL